MPNQSGECQKQKKTNCCRCSPGSHPHFSHVEPWLSCYLWQGRRGMLSPTHLAAWNLVFFLKCSHPCNKPSKSFRTLYTGAAQPGIGQTIGQACPSVNMTSCQAQVAHQQIKCCIGTLHCLFQPAVEFSGLKAGIQASSGAVAVSLTQARPDTETCYESRVTAFMNLQQDGVHVYDVDQLHAQALMLISSSC